LSDEAASQSGTAPLRVAIVIEHFNPTGGGNERSTAQIAESLIARGHEVTLIAGSCRPEHHLDGATMHVLARRRCSRVWRLARFARWARQVLESGKFDVTMSMTMAVPAAVLEPRGGTVRETLKRNIAMRRAPLRRLLKRLTLLVRPKQGLLLKLEKRALRAPQLHTAVALSQYVARQFAEHYALPSGKVRLITNGSHMPTPSDAQRHAWRSKIRSAFQVSDESCVFLFAAHNLKLKGLATLLRALSRLQQRGVDAVVLVAGPAGYREHRAAMQAGVRDRVRFVGPTNEMPAMYAAAEVTVLPTFYDPSSKVVLESLMMRTPAISTAYNGASDFILPEDGPTRGEVLADPADADALAAAMAKLTEPAYRRACAEACAGLDATLSMSRHVDELIAVLLRAAGRSGHDEAAVSSAGRSLV